MKKVNILFFKYYGFPQLKFLEDKDMKYTNWNVILHLNLIFDISMKEADLEY